MAGSFQACLASRSRPAIAYKAILFAKILLTLPGNVFVYALRRTLGAQTGNFDRTGHGFAK
jgi:hypothetical protein